MRKDLIQKPNSENSAGLSLRVGTAFLLVILALASSAMAQGLAGDIFSEDQSSPLLSFLGGLHPLAVHFPLGMAIAALFFESLFVISKNTTWQTSAFHTLTLGSALSIVTIFTGLSASELGPYFAEDALILDSHRMYGLIGAGCLILTTYLGAQSRIKKTDLLIKLYRAGLVLTNFAVYSAGHFGAKLSGLSPF